MGKAVVGGNNKNKKKGETFYEAVSATAEMPKALHLPKLKDATVDFLESIVIFFAGTVEALLLVRVMMMMFGANGGNLLTYLLYATSYPFVLALNPGQEQIPSLANNLIAENVALMVMYIVLSYLLLVVVKAFKDDEKEIN